MQNKIASCHVRNLMGQDAKYVKVGEKMKRNIYQTAVYIRLSNDDGDKEESNSVVNQKKLLTDFVNQKDDLTLYDTYVDDGYTGTNFKRPSFEKMIKDIEKGCIACVVVKDLSRFGRDYIETGRYLERFFPEHGIRFISITDNIDSAKQAYDMLLPIKNIFNEQYSRDISRKIHAAIKTKQKSGDFIGSFCSYGYKKSPTNKNKLIIDEYAASVVRRIFELYIQGVGKQGIAKMLNDEHILCPAEYKKVMGEHYVNSNRLESTTYWSYSTINKILQSEVYIGNLVQGTKQQSMRGCQKRVPKNEWIIVENTHPAIIEKEVWEHVQSLLNKRTRKLDLTTNMSIFAGFLKCGDCGRAMTKNWHTRKDGTKVYRFLCGTYKRNGKAFCTLHSISMNVLEQIILDDLKTIIKSVDDLREFVSKQDTEIAKKKNFTEKEIHRLKVELERVKKLKKEVYEDYKEELLSKEDYMAYRKDYEEKELLYAKQIQNLEEQKKNAVTSNVFETPWLKRLLDKKDIESLDREIIVEMISEILIYEDNRIKIVYNFSNELADLFSSIYNADDE